jgi:6-pyruvoyltetrahydropterin/6-carboxytetrahydropterin synthase
MQRWTLAKKFTFEAAHYLPHHDGKCRRLHGHSWVGYVYCQGSALQTEGSKQGMVLDYSTLKQYLNPLVDDYLDHHYLNDTTGIESPTSEQIAQWIYDRLQEAGLPGLVAVRIDETCTSRCVYSASQLDNFYLCVDNEPT